jgi:hypothetical protein
MPVEAFVQIAVRRETFNARLLVGELNHVNFQHAAKQAKLGL